MKLVRYLVFTLVLLVSSCSSILLESPLPLIAGISFLFVFMLLFTGG